MREKDPKNPFYFNTASNDPSFSSPHFTYSMKERGGSGGSGF